MGEMEAKSELEQVSTEDVESDDEKREPVTHYGEAHLMIDLNREED